MKKGVASPLFRSLSLPIFLSPSLFFLPLSFHWQPPLINHNNSSIIDKRRPTIIPILKRWRMVAVVGEETRRLRRERCDAPKLLHPKSSDIGSRCFWRCSAPGFMGFLLRQWHLQP
ncbi:hypothetical protein MANES_03G096516v8 [Manihot esculenta]|uniref:Uncharacterized protein n=1 Tax=Manihot esculenta TaxID=3983 RepID=A0ACB7HZY8_MANES|nr:hypothetical protein MANES_03G096516v8 [Manihot esculenta]